MSRSADSALAEKLPMFNVPLTPPRPSGCATSNRSRHCSRRSGIRRRCARAPRRAPRPVRCPYYIAPPPPRSSRAVGEVDGARQLLHPHDRLGRAFLYRAARDEREGLALGVLTAIFGAGHLHSLLRHLDLVLGEQEADLGPLSEGRKDHHRGDDADYQRQAEAQDTHDNGRGSTRWSPTAGASCDHDRRGRTCESPPQLCAKISASGQPARSSAARVGRKSKQDCASSMRPSRTSRASRISFIAWRKRTSLAA